MSQPGSAPVGASAAGEDGPPVTGLPALDDALARLADLDEQPVEEHHDQLSHAHEALHDALHAQPGSHDA